MTNGLLITFEGPEGSGKTTMARWLSDFLRQKGYRVLFTREPGGTPVGEAIRELLHAHEHADMTARTEALLFCAARAQLVERVIRPFLAEGGIVVSDRYADSTLAYQGYGRGLDLEDLQHLNRFATGGLRPDLTFLLDIEVEQGLARRRVSGDAWTRLDALELSFHQRVREGYRRMATAEPDRWVIIDASQPMGAVQSAILDHLRQRLGLSIE
ncbi:dTMP kinase [Thermoflexus sp.]|uniref:dTMP kinase n=1 Tax=Thermoflexus sp. TaxID=1969742 RepID=UPI0025FE2253|nr:dTMP kinase [Thermoflexus sp.]MCS6963966.1 dTMP kinase [Thermoflexus sp.]MCX7689749.1 dTMP kinase [Thermoflexus sp.]MDW8064232.1 dTMP kinase [Anaerolineae bacterium]MDW8186079.1 dTMP kinase [Anaerolineae bacterium]